MNPEAAFKAGRLARGAALLFVILSYVAALTSVAVRLAGPSDGSIAQVTERPLADGGIVIAPYAAGSPLRSGDVVISISGIPVEALDQIPSPVWRAGDTLPYRVIRQGSVIDVPVTLGPGSIEPALDHGGELLFGLALQLVGVFVFLRRPGEPAGAALLVAGAAALSSATMRALQGHLPDVAAGRTAWWLAMLGGFIYIVFYSAMLHLILVFPGRHPVLSRVPRAIALAYATPMAIAAGLFAMALASSQSWWPRALAWGVAVRVVNVCLLILAIATLATGYRATRDNRMRQKSKWVVFAIAVLGAVTIIFRQLPGVLFDVRPLGANENWLVALVLPAALAIAILRHQLFDIDILINRALVYGALSAIITAVYVLIVVVLAGALQSRGSLALSLAATALIALLFQPLRDQLKRGVNRLLYGERDEPFSVLARLGRRLEAAWLPGQALAAIVETVAQALGLPYAALHIGGGAARRPRAEHGQPPAESAKLAVFPLTYQSEHVGDLTVAQRDESEPFTETELRLIEVIARQAGPAAYADTLLADLQRSREQLVTAREEERRRLRRDIHDGLGTTLTGVRQLIGQAIDQVGAPSAAAAVLSEAKKQTQQAIADIRRLAYNLRPPVLDELGLAAALREHAARFGYELAVETPLPALSAAVEVAAYRIAIEAANNVDRHAGASRCIIRLRAEPGALWLTVEDNGAGIAEQARAGVGIRSMRERAAELGGSVLIERLAEAGTRVTARLPLPAPEEDDGPNTGADRR